jgi:amino acid adenylation domain-containing protein
MSDGREITARVAGLTAEQRQELVEQLRRRAVARAVASDEVPAPDTGRLSFAEERLWFLQELNPTSAAYNVPVAWRLVGTLDVEALVRALRRLAERHPALRTRVAKIDGEPRQVVEASPEAPLTHVDLTGSNAPYEEAERAAAALAAVPFELDSELPLRAHLLRLETSKHLLLLTFHHIAVDGRSLAIVADELSALVRAESGAGAPAMASATVSHPFRRPVSEARLASAREYWRERLRGLAPLELPAPRPRPAIQSFEGAAHRFSVAPSLTARLKALAEREGTTLFTVLLAALQTLLYRYSGQDDVVVGSPVSARGGDELEHVIGFHVNTLVLRTDFSGDPSFRELLGRAREVALAAYEHQDMPFEKLVEELAPTRDLGRTPLFQVLVGLEEALPELELPGVESTAWPVHNGTSKFDLALLVETHPDHLAATIEYATSLFDAASIEGFAESLKALLESVAEDAARPISRLRILSEDARARILESAVGAALPLPRRRSLVDCFDDSVSRLPGGVAVAAGSERLTYRELDERANYLAHRLRGLGARADTAVGVCLARGLGPAVAVLAILKAGAAYVPLDPVYPEQRLRLMVDDARPVAIVTEPGLEWAFAGTGARLVLLEPGELAATAQSPPDPDAHPESLAYVIFTSGSTGRPRGVAMPHSALLNLLEWQLQASACGVGARTLHFTPLSFDVAFQELFATWASGGTLVVVSEPVRRDPRELAQFILDERIDRVFMPAVALNELAEALCEVEQPDPGRLREIVTAGEQLRVTPALAAAQERYGFSLENQYGPTETHVATAQRLEPPSRAWPDLPPIGRAIANERAYVLDAHLEPVPVGVVGEIFLGGPGIARGYHDDARTTAERFVADPFGPGRLYRTGDLGRMRADGAIEFVGRADAQLKVRGFRVEPGEIEAALCSHPAIADAAVVFSTERAAGELVAHVVRRPDRDLDADSIERLLRKQLPEYMVPGRYEVVGRLPRTPSGKVDRRELATRPVTADLQNRAASGRQPGSAVEQAVAAAWAEVLHEPPASAEISFFACGGHSLLATRLVSLLRRQLGVELRVQDLFEAPTVAELAARVEERGGGKAARDGLPTITPLPRPRR